MSARGKASTSGDKSQARPSTGHAVNRSAPASASRTDHVMSLHGSMGNRAVRGILGGGTGAGRTLESSDRSFFESRFNHDFSRVRVHTDAPAAESARSQGASAYTVANHIVFDRGRYAPETTRGRLLLAHELAHVVQQQGGISAAQGVQRSSAGPASDGCEREARSAAVAAVRGEAVSVCQRTGGATVQKGLWDDFTSAVSGAVSAVGGAVSSAVGAVAGAVSSAVSAVGSAARTVAGAVGSALSSAWGAATRFLGSAASWVISGLRTLGSAALSWLSRAGRAVWDAIRWFGARAWEGIRWMGAFLWEKLSLLGTLAWSFITNIPARFWRIVVHLWHGVTGALGWLWSGFKGLAGWAWGAVTGVFRWLGTGLRGALGWIANGVRRGAVWAIEFLLHPSFSKLIDGLLGALSWLGGGVRGLARWAWNGVVAAAVWAWSGIRRFCRWLWDGVLGGLKWIGEMILYLLEYFGVGELLELIWGLIFRMRRLTAAERSASLEVHAGGQVPYGLVWVDDNSVLIKIGTTLARWFGTKVSPGAITTMHIVHMPSAGTNLPVMVHELTHVAQYEKVGAVYMPQALHAQHAGAGYNYGDLAAQRAAGKRYRDFNREQQASICEDYYKVKHGIPPDYSGTLATLQPFIDDMRRGGF